MEPAERWAADGTPAYLSKPPLHELWQQSERTGPRFSWNSAALIVDGAKFTHVECEQTPEIVAATIKGVLDAYRRRRIVYADPPPTGESLIFDRESSWPEIRCHYKYGYDR
jgi:hypothetical protein